MPISLTGLVTGGNRLLAARGRGQVEGEDKRLEREQQAAEIQRQALRDSLLDRYQSSQIDYMNAGTQQRLQPKAPKAGLTVDDQLRLIQERGNQARETQAARPRAAGRVASTAANAQLTETQANSQGAVDRLVDTNNRLSGLYRADRGNATRPWSNAIGQVGAGLARKVLGPQNELAEGLDMQGLNTAQQTYQPMTDEWTHQYIVFLPRFRSGKDMYANVKHAYFPRVGVRDPAVLRSFQERRENATRSIVAARNRGASPEEIENILIGDMQRHLGPRADLVAPPGGADAGAESPARTGGSGGAAGAGGPSRSNAAVEAYRRRIRAEARP